MNCGIHLVLAVSLLHQLALRAMCKPQLTEGCDGEGNCEEHQRSLLQPRVIMNNLHIPGAYVAGQGCCRFDDYTVKGTSHRDKESCLIGCKNDPECIAAALYPHSSLTWAWNSCWHYFGKGGHFHTSGKCSACWTFGRTTPDPTPMPTPMPTLMPTPMPTEVPDCRCTGFKNQFECTDGTKRFCASDEQCEFGKKFKKWKWSPKWPNGCQHTSYFWKKKFPPLP
mmetsp:Transcript_67380/g.132929  ORF Transcript_67380/g.132929 Transcript_67380/m.132929 type:complete len:224 (+) Transcript_67380:80-751(+)